MRPNVRAADDGSSTRSTFRSKTNELAAISRRTLRANVSRTVEKEGGRRRENCLGITAITHGECAIWYKSRFPAAPHPIVRLNRRGRMELGELIAKLCLSRGDTCKDVLPCHEGCSRGSIVPSQDKTVASTDVYLNRSIARIPILKFYVLFTEIILTLLHIKDSSMRCKNASNI